MAAPKEAEVFAKFLKGKKILIADSSAAARSGLFSVLRDLGADPSQLVLSNAFIQAQQQITELRPNIVIAEYELGRRCGLELLQSQRMQHPEATKDCIFV